DLARSPGAFGPERAGADGNDPHGVGGLVAGLALLPAVRLRHDAGPGPPRPSPLPLLHVLGRPAQGLAHLSVEGAARGGARTLRPRTACFPDTGGSGSTAAATDRRFFRSAPALARVRGAHRLRRFDR